MVLSTAPVLVSAFMLRDVSEPWADSIEIWRFGSGINEPNRKNLTTDLAEHFPWGCGYFRLGPDRSFSPPLLYPLVCHAFFVCEASSCQGGDYRWEKLEAPELLWN